MAGGWPRVAAATATEVCANYAVEPEATAALAPGATPAAFVSALAGRELYGDAVAFLAQALPIRECLWWVCECVRAGPSAVAARAYVLDPTDANRRAAMAAAEVEGFDTPGGALAAAAFFSAGSLSEPDLPPVPPPEGIAATTAANAICLAAVLGDPAGADDRFRAFLDIGKAVAAGTSRWA